MRGFAEGEKVAAWLGEQLTAGLFSKDAPSGGYFSDDFNTGKVAMYYGSCAGVPYIKPNGFEYAVAPAPSSTSEYKSYTIWNRGPIVFKYEGQDARAEGAYEFVKYLLATPEISEGWAEAMIAMTPWVAAQQVEGYEAFVASQPALAARAGPHRHRRVSALRHRRFRVPRCAEEPGGCAAGRHRARHRAGRLRGRVQRRAAGQVIRPLAENRNRSGSPFFCLTDGQGTAPVDAVPYPCAISLQTEGEVRTHASKT